MPPFARADLEQIGRKMACNEYIGASLDTFATLSAVRFFALLRMTGCYVG